MTKALVALILLGGCASSSVYKFKDPREWTPESWCKDIERGSAQTKNEANLAFIHTTTNCVAASNTLVEAKSPQSGGDYHYNAHYLVCMNNAGYQNCE